MDPTRRHALRALAAAALAPLAAPLAAPLLGPQEALAAWAGEQPSPINVMVPSTWRPPLEGGQAERYAFCLGRAVLAFVDDHYRGLPLPVWGRPAEAMDLEKRVVNIVHWVVRSTADHASVHPVDPAWVMAQIMAESFYNEFAVSRALAVGICQFIGPTARGFDMLCAGDRPEHHGPPLKEPGLAGEEERYYERRAAWKKAVRRRDALAPDARDTLLELARTQAQGSAWPKAEAYLQAQEQVDELDAQVKDARAAFQQYLEANLQGRSIFDKADLGFLKGFDERVLYRKPIDAMVLMLARALRVRGGNMLAATAAYHAGPGLTSDDARIYGRYGRIPVIEETITYISRILVNHHEIVARI